MRHTVQLSIFTLLFVGVFSLSIKAGEQREIDSLKSLLENAKYDSNRVNLLNNLCWKYKYKDPAVALEYVNEALQLANTLRFVSGVAKSNNFLGIINLTQGNYDVAIELHLNSLRLYEKMTDKYGIGSSLVNLGVVYYYLDYLEKANEYYIKALNIWRELDIKKQIAGTYNNIAIVFREQKKYVESLDYYSRSLSIREDLNDKKGISECLNNIGTLHARLNEHKKAISYYKRSLIIDEERDDKMGISIILFNISELHYKQNDLKKAKKYLKRSLDIVDEIEADDMKKSIYESYANIYSKENRFEDAFKYHKLYSQIKDSLFNAESSQQIAEMETKYQSAKKEQEITLLNKENEINSLELSKKEAEVNKQRIIIFSSFGILIFAIIFGLLLYNRYLLKQKAHSLLQRKNKQITDSINYARRIQNAILPSDQLIHQCLPNSFVLFKPKSVVSGDFYWIHKHEHEIMFAALDCTGHGVPGAFMSMIGNTLLNEIVAEKEITKPSEVLKQLHAGVNKALNQENSRTSSKDGMDLAFCTLDPETLSLQYAGSHNPLYIIRNDKLQETLGDTLYIGDDRFGNDYTNHTLQVQKDDMIYLFTDGYPDQQGGPLNKKFYYQKFRKLLLDIHKKPMDDQKEHLDQAMADWMGVNEQIDDILVFGVKV